MEIIPLHYLGKNLHLLGCIDGLREIGMPDRLLTVHDHQMFSLIKIYVHLNLQFSCPHSDLFFPPLKSKVF